MGLEWAKVVNLKILCINCVDMTSRRASIDTISKGIECDDSKMQQFTIDNIGSIKQMHIPHETF